MIEISDYIEINGIKQYVLITGNENGPLMLFLHGGPGVSQIGFIRKYQSKLEKKFLVVNWDQRGAGKSNIKKFSRKELTIDNIINDAISLIKILRERFKKTHVYLIGHSFGSLIGIILAQKIPQYIKVYISVGQVVNINEADKVTYKLLSQKIKKENNKKGINILKKIGKPPYVTKDSIRNLDKLIEKYKGDIFKINKLSFILNSISFKYYSIFDWFRFLRGSVISKKYMYSEMAAINLFNLSNKFEVPIYFCCGDNDYHTPSKIIEDYYNFIDAPKKALYKFKTSAHMPNVEEELCFYNMCKSIYLDNE